MFDITEKILLTQNIERHKEIYSELQCLSTRHCKFEK